MVEIFIFLCGLIIGSFLNMLIYRLPKGVSLLNPKRSICPQCNHIIKWYENMPFFSYLFLKGKCSNCKKKISLFYPFVEVLFGIILVVLCIKIGLHLEFLLLSFVIATLLVLSIIDIHYKAVPDYLLVVALVGAFFINEFSFLYCLVFAGGAVLLEFFVTFYIQNIKYRITKDEGLLEQKALGEGDIPIFALIGGVLGLQLGVVAIFLAAVFAIIPSILNKIKNGDLELPFIPFLSLGFLVVYLGENNIVSILEKLGL